MRKNNKGKLFLFYSFLLSIIALTGVAFYYGIGTKSSKSSAGIAKTYYVDKDSKGGKCANTNSGTALNTPFCTISYAITKVVPGDIILVRAGTYPGFAVTKKGVLGSFITLSNYNGEKVIIDGAKKDLGIDIRGISYVKVNGFEVKNVSYSWGGAINVKTSNNIEVTNNIVHDNTGSNTSGIKVEDSTNVLVQGNSTYNNYYVGIRVIGNSSVLASMTGVKIINNTSYNNTLSGGDSDGIGINGSSVKGTIIQGNKVYGNSDDGIDTWDSNGNVIEYNVTYNHKGPGDGNGIKAGGSSTGGNNIVRYNISYNNLLSGITSNGSGGNKYYNNVVYNNTRWGIEDSARNQYKNSTGTLSNCSVTTCPGVLKNNIGLNNGRGNASLGKYTSVSTNNIWYDTASKTAKVAYNYSIYSTLPLFYKASGNRLDNPVNGTLSSYSVNPLFVNLTTPDFHLTATSPAIDKGDKTNPGGQLIKGLAPDIGVFENR